MVRDELTDQCSHWVLTSWVFPLCSHHVSPVHVRDFGPPPRGGGLPEAGDAGAGPAHGGPGGRLRHRYRGGGPGAGRDGTLAATSPLLTRGTSALPAPPLTAVSISSSSSSSPLLPFLRVPPTERFQRP